MSAEPKMEAVPEAKPEAQVEQKPEDKAPEVTEPKVESKVEATDKTEAQVGTGIFARNGWTLEYVSKETLLGLTIGFAQIPESVAFAFLANIKPPIALHAAWMVGLVCSVFGGRPAMVNGATGAFAAIIATFLPEPIENGGNGLGVETLFPSVMFAGFLMLIVGMLNLSKFILLLPAPVMVGFCNGLAIVIGLAQLHPFKDSSTHDWKAGEETGWMVAIMLASMLTMEFLPKLPLKIFKIIPSSLCAIIVAIIMEFAIVRPAGYRTDTIRDVSEFTADTAYPCPFFIDSPGRVYDLDALTKGDTFVDWVKGPGGTIFVQGLLLAIVGVIESLMTSEVVESFVKTPSDGKRTVLAMGVGNILSGFSGGMGGNAMIGLSTINVLNGGKGRLAPTVTALVVMAACVGAYPLLNFIPVAALAGIMLVVVLHTFKWYSLTMLLSFFPKRIRQNFGTWGERKVPRIEVFVIVMVTLVSVFFNIAYSVIAGVTVCAIAFSWNAAATMEVTITDCAEDGTRIYHIEGPVFFTTANKLLKIFDVDNDPENVEVVFGYSSLMDYTAISTLHRVASDYSAKKKKITYKSLNLSSQKLVEKANDLVKNLKFEARSVEPKVVEGPVAKSAGDKIVPALAASAEPVAYVTI